MPQLMKLPLWSEWLNVTAPLCCIQIQTYINIILQSPSFCLLGLLNFNPVGGFKLIVRIITYLFFPPNFLRRHISPILLLFRQYNLSTCWKLKRWWKKKEKKSLSIGELITWHNGLPLSLRLLLLMGSAIFYKKKLVLLRKFGLEFSCLSWQVTNLNRPK